MFPLLLLMSCTAAMGTSNDTCPNPVILGKNNATYCNVTSFWNPRLTEVEAMAAFLIPLLFTIVVYIITLGFTGKDFLYCYKEYKKCPQMHTTSTTSTSEWIGKCRFVWFWCVAPFSIMVYDIIDVGLDSYYFMELEMGRLIDKSIMRNAQINNAILAFACLGALKSILIAYILRYSLDRLKEFINFKRLEYRVSSHAQVRNARIIVTSENAIIPIHTEPSTEPSTEHTTEPNKDITKKYNTQLLKEARKHFVTCYKPLIALIALFFEDVVQQFLQYCYVDIYTTGEEWMVFVRSITLLVLAICSSLPKLWDLKTQLYETTQQVMVESNLRAGIRNVALLYIPVVLMSISQVGRLIACIYQAYTGIINKVCLHVIAGALVQSPFADGCFQGGDWPILVLPWVLLVAALVGFCPFFL